MNGPDELNVIDTMRDFNVEDTCQNINVPTMIINGEFNECTELAVQMLFDKIPKAKRITVPG
ncbi:hypothetical protein TGAMA5MH_04605 [Trichoderma gamsii]|uniref:Uncharacterized protein n=1 Tax=Trichoderma gamsii TaxID=398673 RepID=A0A2K0TDN3_9HYPO|nr:hypothetical protein TGAMA5MH_04605 [Trichoderma gamsii]